MAAQLSPVTEALERLALSIENGWGNDQAFIEAWGWQAAPITKHDLSKIVRKRKDEIASLSDEKLTADLKTGLLNLAGRIDAVIGQVVPQLWGGNNISAISAINHLLQAVDVICEPHLEVEINWVKVQRDGKIPRELAVKLRSIEANVQRVSERSDGLDGKIRLIEAAYHAAESLPTDLQTLQEARAEVEKIRSGVEAADKAVNGVLDQVKIGLKSIKEAESEATQLVANCGDAYSAATTKGLGEAFTQKANELKMSMWIWVGGLVVALAAGSWLGRSQVDALRLSMSSKDVDSSIVFVNFLVVLFSIAAPIWFAWVATKQISHRFKLSEDYGFKASVARAYEGYRREAARLDPEFASRLFSTALDRIEEPPLRFVDIDNHASPLSEVAEKVSRIRLPNFRAGASVPRSKRTVEVSPQVGKQGVNSTDSEVAPE